MGSHSFGHTVSKTSMLIERGKQSEQPGNEREGNGTNEDEAQHVPQTGDHVVSLFCCHVYPDVFDDQYHWQLH